MSTARTTEVYDSYWRFAAERVAVYERRLGNPVGPWTDDPIIAAHRFTNAFRAADRVSQHLIRDVQYDERRSQAASEIFFRTILFKTFNRIDTWDLIERETGSVSWQSFDLEAVTQCLDAAMRGGASIYSAAYIMPSPPFGHARKHANHLALMVRMMDEGLPGRISAANSLEEVYRLILAYPGVGPFLAFQYAIDLNYSTMIDFDEDDFVVAGPGALDGISKCFSDTGGLAAADVIAKVTERQNDEFERLGIEFRGLFGRPLKRIDAQNLFCEISKYARVAHPHIPGVAGRTRIKQGYATEGAGMIRDPFFPPKWGLTPPAASKLEATPPAQTELFG